MIFQGKSCFIMANDICFKDTVQINIIFYDYHSVDVFQNNY